MLQALIYICITHASYGQHWLLTAPAVHKEIEGQERWESSLLLVAAFVTPERRAAFPMLSCPLLQRVDLASLTHPLLF